MRTIISLAIAIFIHLSVILFFLYPQRMRKETTVLQTSPGRPSTIDLTKFNIHKNTIKAGARNTSLPVTTATGTGNAQLLPQDLATNSSAKNTDALNQFEQPEYPRMARLRGFEGKVIIKITFNDQGIVNNTAILESSSHLILDEAVTKSVLKWKSASLHNQIFVKSFEFKLKN
jgi:protein TonB